MPPTRILIVAENASTRSGGEAILPHHYFRLLRARGLDAHLIVHARMREELDQTFAHDLDHLHYVADQPLQRLFYKAGRILPRRVDEATLGLANQLLTQRAQRAILRTLVLPGATVIHQPIPVSPRFPSAMHSLGAPVVIGPLNGGMEYPPAFRTAESLLTRSLITIGRTFTDLTNTLFPGKRKAAVVLVANQRTREALPQGITGEIIELVENGVDLAQWTQIDPSREAIPPGKPPRFLFIGRLVDWKALEIALQALPPTVHLDVVGDGPMRAAWQAEAGPNVTFHGWRTQPECAQLLAGATALLLPSVYECGGAVVLEAMAASVPVIATAWGGPLDYLDPTCGILLSPTSREALVQGFRNAMLTLAADPALQQQMGKAAQQKAQRHFDWNRKIDAILAIYDRAGSA